MVWLVFVVLAVRLPLKSRFGFPFFWGDFRRRPVLVDAVETADDNPVLRLRLAARSSQPRLACFGVQLAPAVREGV